MARIRYILILMSAMLLALPYAPLFSQQPVPKNGKIAFVSDRDGNQEIYVMEADGSNVQRLTFSEGSDVLPDWSPDGTQLIFQSRRNNTTGIYIMNADGSGLVNLVSDSARYPAWSPNGNLIAFSRGTEQGSEIYTIAINGENLQKVVSGDDGIENFAPAWSPDGESILYSTTDEIIGGRNGNSGYFELKIVRLINGKQQTLYPLDAEGSPDWSWVRNEDPIALSFKGLASRTVIRLAADGSSTTARYVTSQPHPLGNESRYDDYPSWSPDGTKIVFSSSVFISEEGSDYDIYITDADREQLVNLTPGTDSNDIMPDWQPIN